MSLFEVETIELSSKRKFYGKYRGTVVNNIDPKGMARLLAVVPDVSNVALTSWAMPSLPWCGPQMGMVCVPPIGAGVWIEFEQGNADYPIWSGCYWGSPAEVPRSATPPSLGVTFQTLGQNIMQLSETGIKLSTKLGSIEIGEDKIKISHGIGKAATIELSFVTVKVNDDALEII